MLSFELPTAVLLSPLPALIWYWLPAAAPQQRAIRAPFFQQWAELDGGRTNSRHGQRATGRLLLLTAIWLNLIAAAAQPVWLGAPQAQTVSGRELLLAVDLSESMTVEDMELGGRAVPRIEAVKDVVGEFISRRQGDKLGLVLFGTQAYYHVPLTFDLSTLSTLLSESQPGFAGQTTAIGDAIGLSVKHLLERPEQSRVVILLTDGANTGGTTDPVKAASKAAEAGIKIYTIGVGANEMIIPGLFGSNLGARRVNPSADLDEETLRKIAELTDGRYFRAANTGELEAIYQLLDQLEPTGEDQIIFRPQVSLAHWPLAIALVLSTLLAGWLTLPGLRFRRPSP